MRIWILIIWIFCSISLIAQPTSIDANISYATFHSPNKNYIELNIEVLGNTMNFVSIDSLSFQGAAEVVILFKQGEQIVKFDKYRLNSPIFNRKSLNTLNFVDVKRYSLDNGQYDLEISLKDLNIEQSAKKYQTTFTLQYDKSAVYISDLVALKSFKPSTDKESPQVKNGYWMEWHGQAVYARELKKMPFYLEIYNTDSIVRDAFVAKYYIEKVENGKTEKIPALVRYKRLKPEAIHVLLFNFSIAQLPTGEYNLVVEARTRNDKLLAERKLNFYRQNPYLNFDLEKYTTLDLENTFVEKLDSSGLDYCLKAVTPQIDQYNNVYLRDLMKTDNWHGQRQFLYGYWLTQDAQTPLVPFRAYMQKVMDIDKKFKSTLGYGFETDRGHIYLKYGAPNEIVREESDPGAPPYEIWRYNELEDQQDVKFLFYNPNLAGNNYDLLHSNKRGELQNPQWERELYKNSPLRDGNFVDGNNAPDSFGRYARQLFDGN